MPEGHAAIQGYLDRLEKWEIQSPAPEKEQPHAPVCPVEAPHNWKVAQQNRT